VSLDESHSLVIWLQDDESRNNTGLDILLDILVLLSVFKQELYKKFEILFKYIDILSNFVNIKIYGWQVT